MKRSEKRAELQRMLKAVDALAVAMKDKLREKARQGYAGGLSTTEVSSGQLGKMLLEHAERGMGVCPHCHVQNGEVGDEDARQMIDVANLSMMIWERAGRPE